MHSIKQREVFSNNLRSGKYRFCHNREVAHTILSLNSYIFILEKHIKPCHIKYIRDMYKPALKFLDNETKGFFLTDPMYHYLVACVAMANKVLTKVYNVDRFDISKTGGICKRN